MKAAFPEVADGLGGWFLAAGRQVGLVGGPFVRVAGDDLGVR